MNSYGTWLEQSSIPGPYFPVSDADALWATGQYRVLTPSQFIDEARTARSRSSSSHPLCGGMPVELAWASLRLFENEVLPAFA